MWGNAIFEERNQDSVFLKGLELAGPPDVFGLMN
jgi:hypothetical protein